MTEARGKGTLTYSVGGEEVLKIEDVTVDISQTFEGPGVKSTPMTFEAQETLRPWEALDKVVTEFEKEHPGMVIGSITVWDLEGTSSRKRSDNWALWSKIARAKKAAAHEMSLEGE